MFSNYTLYIKIYFLVTNLLYKSICLSIFPAFRNELQDMISWQPFQGTRLKTLVCQSFYKINVYKILLFFLHNLNYFLKIVALCANTCENFRLSPWLFFLIVKHHYLSKFHTQLLFW